MEWDNSTCLLLLDLTPLCGDFARAFVNLEKGSDIPMRYYGISESKELDWQMGSLSQILIDSYLDGKLTPPAGTVIPEKNPPKEHMEAEPEPPSFKRLTFNKVSLMIKTVLQPFIQKCFHFLFDSYIFLGPSHNNALS